MVPNRIVPQYDLFKMYIELGEKEKFVEMADAIACQYVKVKSSVFVSLQIGLDRINLISKKQKSRMNPTIYAALRLFVFYGVIPLGLY